MLVKPKQLHSLVGTAFGLAVETHSLRKMPTRTQDHVWFMLFPRVSEIEKLDPQSQVEVDRRISMRAGRSGRNTWSLKILDVIDVMHSFDEDAIPLLGYTEEGPIPLFTQVGQGVLRTVSSFRWSQREVYESSRIYQVIGPYGNENPSSTEPQMSTNSGDVLLDDHAMLTELDMMTLNEKDIEQIRADIAAHLACYRQLILADKR